MELTNPIRLRRQWWVVLDLLAIALIIGAAVGLIALAAGAWAPLDPLGIQVGWSGGLLLFAEAMLIIFVAGTLIGVNVAVLANRKAAAAAEDAVPVGARDRSPRASQSRTPRATLVGPHG